MCAPPLSISHASLPSFKKKKKIMNSKKDVICAIGGEMSSDQILGERWEESVIIECLLSIWHATSCCMTWVCYWFLLNLPSAPEIIYASHHSQWSNWGSAMWSTCDAHMAWQWWSWASSSRPLSSGCHPPCHWFSGNQTLILKIILLHIPHRFLNVQVFR